MTSPFASKSKYKASLEEELLNLDLRETFNFWGAINKQAGIIGCPRLWVWSSLLSSKKTDTRLKCERG